MKEPAPVAILAARLQRAYPSLSPYSAASLAEELSRIERAQRRHAERCCSGADGGYVRKRKVVALAGIADPLRRDDVEHDPAAEQRAGKRLETRVVRWVNRLVAYHDNGPVNTLPVADRNPTIELQGDPRGPVLLVQLPGETETVAV